MEVQGSGSTAQVSGVRHVTCPTYLPRTILLRQRLPTHNARYSCCHLNQSWTPPLLQVTQCRIYNHKQNAIFANEGAQVLVSDCMVYGSKKLSGASAKGEGSCITIANTKLFGCQQAAILASRSGVIRASHCTLYGCKVRQRTPHPPLRSARVIPAESLLLSGGGMGGATQWLNPLPPLCFLVGSGRVGAHRGRGGPGSLHRVQQRGATGL